MTIKIILTCSGPQGTDEKCPHAHRGFEASCADGHENIRSYGWPEVRQAALDAGWKVGKKDQHLRCPDCDAKGNGVISGYPRAVWEECLRRFLAGQGPATWRGEQGMPTPEQWHNAVHRYPWLKDRMKESEHYKGGYERQGRVNESMWAKVAERVKAGEWRDDICNSRGGWPSVRQWDSRRKHDPYFKKFLDDLRAQYRAEVDAKLDQGYEDFVAGGFISDIFPDNAMRLQWFVRCQKDEAFRAKVFAEHTRRRDAGYGRGGAGGYSSEMYDAALEWVASGNSVATLPGTPRTASTSSFHRRVGKDFAFAARYNAALERAGSSGAIKVSRSLNLALDWDGALGDIADGMLIPDALKDPRRPTQAQWVFRKRNDPAFANLLLEIEKTRAKQRSLDFHAKKLEREAEKAATEAAKVLARDIKAKQKAEAKAAKKKQQALEAQRRKQEYQPLGAVLKESLSHNELYSAANKAVSLGLPAHIRDDVIGAIVLAVLEGEMDVEDIRPTAREFVAAYHREAGTYKTVSTDAVVGGTEDLRLIDTLDQDTERF